MNAKNRDTKTATKSDFNATRYLWIGCAMGLACMAALFIVGMTTGSAGMTVMAASTAGLILVVCSSTAAAAKSAAKKSASATSA